MVLQQTREVDAEDGISVLRGETAKDPFEHHQISMGAALGGMLGNGGVAKMAAVHRVCSPRPVSLAMLPALGTKGNRAKDSGGLRPVVPRNYNVVNFTGITETEPISP